MTELQQKQLALLEDTVKFFNSENRAYDIELGACMYHTKDEKGCAIGRLIPDKELCRQLDAGIGEDKFRGVGKDCVFQLLPLNLQEYSQLFLKRLQSLHDYPLNWNEKGLSDEGEQRTNEIKKEFHLN